MTYDESIDVLLSHLRDDPMQWGVHDGEVQTSFVVPGPGDNLLVVVRMVKPDEYEATNWAAGADLNTHELVINGYVVESNSVRKNKLRQIWRRAHQQQEDVMAEFIRASVEALFPPRESPGGGPGAASDGTVEGTGGATKGGGAK